MNIIDISRAVQVETVRELDRTKDFSQNAIARILAVTPPCVSMYLQEQRGARSSISIESKRQLKRDIELLCKNYIDEGDFQLRLCDLIKSELKIQCGYEARNASGQSISDRGRL